MVATFLIALCLALVVRVRGGGYALLMVFSLAVLIGASSASHIRLALAPTVKTKRD